MFFGLMPVAAVTYQSFSAPDGAPVLIKGLLVAYGLLMLVGLCLMLKGLRHKPPDAFG